MSDNIVHMLFSFEGRMRRRDFWLCLIGIGVVQWLLQSFILSLFFPPVIWVGGDAYAFWQWSWWAHVGPAVSLANLLMLWPRLAVGVKRCHDRDKTGLWLLLICIPVLGWLWLLVDLGFLDGTPGPNRYGPSPKGIGSGASPAAA
jgi:uncharacterized membrane protein YhaH (DUF805 family)